MAAEVVVVVEASIKNAVVEFSAEASAVVDLPLTVVASASVGVVGQLVTSVEALAAVVGALAELLISVVAGVVASNAVSDASLVAVDA